MRSVKWLRWGFIAFSLCGSLLGVPASPDIQVLKQPNGYLVQARIWGDEFRGWMETLEGYTIVQNEANGYWEYAVIERASGTLQPSGRWVNPGTSPPAEVEKHLKPTWNKEMEKVQKDLLKLLRNQQKSKAVEAMAGPALAPVSGTKKLLVILVNFTNRTLTTTATSWSNVLFQTGTGVKSVRQYYKDNSFNLLDIEPIAHTQSGNPSGVVTVTIGIDHPNYGGTFNYATETAWLNLALAQAASYVDFAALDTSNNGSISVDEAVIYFIPAGYERSGTTKTPNIWAHAWGGTPGLTAGTKYIPRWAMNGELNNYDRQHPMGVIAHELGHAMAGLPDLYDYTDTNEGLGIFSLMASGSWGSNTGEDSGTTPVTLDAWCREYLVWTTPQLPASGSTVTLGTCLSGATAAAKLQNTAFSTTEYYLVENRNPSSWDQGMVRLGVGSSWTGGLLVIHVDSTLDPNDYVAGGHQAVMAEHADNAAYGSGGTDGSFFRASGNSSFTPLSSPSSNFYAGASAIQMTNASAPGTSMTFNTSILVDTTAPTGTLTTPTGSANLDSLTFNWTLGTATDAESGITGYYLQVGTTAGGNDVFDGLVGNVLTKTLNHVQDGKTYYARVRAMNGVGLYGTYSGNSSGVIVNLPSVSCTTLDNCALTYKTAGDQLWVAQTTTSHAGGSAAASGTISDLSSTYLQTTVTGPGVFKFWWKVSSEADYDFLTFSIDGVNQSGRISGEVDWTQKSFDIAAGTHVLRWTYAKDDYTQSGADKGYVDTVEWSGTTCDVNSDGVVDVIDILILTRAYGSTTGSANWNAAADLNGDGTIDGADVSILLAGF